MSDFAQRGWRNRTLGQAGPASIAATQQGSVVFADMHAVAGHVSIAQSGVRER